MRLFYLKHCLTGQRVASHLPQNSGSSDTELTTVPMRCEAPRCSRQHFITSTWTRTQSRDAIHLDGLNTWWLSDFKGIVTQNIFLFLKMWSQWLYRSLKHRFTKTSQKTKSSQDRVPKKTANYPHFVDKGRDHHKTNYHHRPLMHQNQPLNHYHHHKKSQQ